MKKVTYLNVLLLFILTTIFMSGGAIPQKANSLDSWNGSEESVTGNMLLFTDPAGRLVIAVDEAKDGQQPDGTMDKYYWYKSSRSFANESTIKLTGTNIVYRGRSLELSSPDHGVRLLFKFDPIDLSSRREALDIQDTKVVAAVFTRLISPSISQTSGRSVSEYSILGGYELGRAIPPGGVPLSRDAISQVVTQNDPIVIEGDCDAGGVGSSGCSVQNTSGSCSVDCNSGYYACCNYGGVLSNPSCKCIKG